MEFTFKKMADDIKAANQNFHDAKIEKERGEHDAEINRLIKAFETRFNRFLPILKTDGIQYRAGLNKFNNKHSGTFIEFILNGYSLKMDFSTEKLYRFEHITNGNIGKMIFGDWSDEMFIVFIADELIAKHLERKKFDSLTKAHKCNNCKKLINFHNIINGIAYCN